MPYTRQEKSASTPEGSPPGPAADRSGGATAAAIVALLAAGLLAAAGTLTAGPPGVDGEGASPGNDRFQEPSGAAQARCGPGSTKRIRSAYRQLDDLLERRGSLSRETFERRLASLVAEAMAPEVTGARIFGQDGWASLGDHRRGEFTAALTRYVRRKLLAFVEADGGALPEIRASQDEVESENGGVATDYWLVRNGSTEPVTFHLATGADDACGVVDVRGLDAGLVERARARVQKLRQDYSFPYMIAEIGGYDHVVLEDFERTPVGELPVGWTWKDQDDDKNKPYRVRVEDGNKYLEATDEGESVILGREIKWNLDEYPLVSFRVRVNEIPEGADERYDDRVDSAAGLYFTVKKKMFGLIPESVKYVWSSTLPVGSATIRDGIGRPWQVVFGTGKEGLGEWRTYYFDLRQAYRDTFGGNPPSKPLGVGVLSDANSMNSKAYADYDDIRALRSAPPGVTVTSGVREILETP